ncbi:hypothetical protein J7L13_03090 [bacterium]|nr:hypothetical protein [bacterium]
MVNVGKWAFVLGVVVAVISGFWTLSAVTAVMVILGLIVGFLNITEEEAVPYLVASATLMLVGLAGKEVVNTVTAWGGNWVNLGSMLTNFLAFVGASALVVAIKAILALGREG